MTGRLRWICHFAAGKAVDEGLRLTQFGHRLGHPSQPCGGRPFGLPSVAQAPDGDARQMAVDDAADIAGAGLHPGLPKLA